MSTRNQESKIESHMGLESYLNHHNELAFICQFAKHLSLAAHKVNNFNLDLTANLKCLLHED